MKTRSLAVSAEDQKSRYRTGSGPGSPCGHPAWGGGCDRPVRLL